ncbi:MAG: hypothetical protein KIT87_01530 [Anaerolineae bacterium]|nr:hypothetical protein [Anaerolineae bacterium]
MAQEQGEKQVQTDKRGSSGEQMSDVDTSTQGPGERVSGSTIPAQSPAGLQSLGTGESRSNESGLDPSGASESRPHYGLGDRSEAGMGRGDEGTGGGYGSRGRTRETGGTGAEDQTGTMQGQSGSEEA